MAAASAVLVTGELVEVQMGLPFFVCDQQGEVVGGHDVEHIEYTRFADHVPAVRPRVQCIWHATNPATD